MAVANDGGVDFDKLLAALPACRPCRVCQSFEREVHIIFQLRTAQNARRRCDTQVS